MSEVAIAQRYGRISAAIQRYGVGRSKLYQIAREHPGLMRKLDKLTFFDFKKLDAIIASAPAIEFEGNNFERKERNK